MKTRTSKNKKLIEDLFQQIETELGYHIIDKQFGNCYFIIESKEPDTICHFHIKELPGYLFGIWNICRYDTIKYELENNLTLWSDNLHINSKSELIFFTQYEKEIDKFKPSRSGMVTGLRRITYEEDNKLITEWDIDELELVLSYMKKHKYKAYVNIYNENKFVYKEYNSFRCFRTYYRHKFDRVIKTIKDKLQLNKDKRIAKYIVNKIKNSCYYYIMDYGPNCYPRIHLCTKQKENISEEEYNEYIDIIQKYEYKYTKLSIYWLDNGYIKNIKTRKDKQEFNNLKQRFDQIKFTLKEQNEIEDVNDRIILIDTNVNQII